MPKVSPDPSENGHVSEETAARFAKHFREKRKARASGKSNPTDDRFETIKKIYAKLRPAPEEWTKADAGDTSGTLEFATMAELEDEISDVHFLVPGWIPLGMVTGVIAETGIGKSAFALCGIGKPLMTGDEWFTGDSPEHAGPVILCPTESDLNLTKERCRDWEIPLDMLNIAGKTDGFVIDSKSVNAVANRVERIGAQLVVVDSLRGGHSGDENSSKTYSTLKMLADLASKTGAAVVVVHHTRKIPAGERIEMNSSRGSNAQLQLMRCVIGIDKPDPTRPDVCCFRNLKRNLPVSDDARGFRITDTGLRFCEAPQPPRRGPSRRDAAEDFLRREMRPGKWVDAGPLIAAAEAAGIRDNALKLAREQLGITLKRGNLKKDGTKGWKWRLPKSD